MTPYLIFTDLDGTLLSSRDYSFGASERALAEIKNHRIPLIINSSKTSAEIADIRTALVNNDPYIVENGAAVYIPENLGFDRALRQHSFSLSYEAIIEVIHDLRKRHGFAFSGFHDLSIDEVSETTGLSLAEAANAKQRVGTEPILWSDDESRLAYFEKEIKRRNLKLVKGGRFYHVMGLHADKAHAMNWLVRQYRRRYGIDFKIIALGDSENDIAMLEQSDIAAVINREEEGVLPLNKAQSEVIYTRQQAPRGWQEALDEIFKRIRIGQYDE
ncbi:MAG: HAD-IIB family hydrolase [Gammaproteobacteria bacterium]